MVAPSTNPQPRLAEAQATVEPHTSMLSPTKLDKLTRIPIIPMLAELVVLFPLLILVVVATEAMVVTAALQAPKSHLMKTALI